MVVVGAPGRPIVHQHCGCLDVAAKRAGQHAAHGLAALIGASLKHEREARMVVEHGVSGWQRPRLSKGKWPLKSICHSSLGALTFETLERALSGRGGGVEQPGAAQNASHGARRQRLDRLGNQAPARACARNTSCAIRAEVGPPPVQTPSSGARGTAPGPLGESLQDRSPPPAHSAPATCSRSSP